MKHLLVLLCLAASPAWSLSCLRPDIVTTYEYARDAEEPFWIIRGKVLSDVPLAMPKADESGRYKDDASASTPVRVLGRGLRTDGTYRVTLQDVTLTISCFAHWCGSIALDEELFMAVEATATGPELIVDPCSSRVVPFTEDGERRLLRCVRDGVCDRQQ